MRTAQVAQVIPSTSKSSVSALRTPVSAEDGVALLLYGFFDSVEADLTLVIGNGKGGVGYGYVHVFHSGKGANRTFETRLAVVAVDFWDQENLLHGPESTWYAAF